MDRIAFLKDFIEKNPDDMFARHALGLEFIKLGSDAEAEILFREVLALQPSYIGTYYHLGKLLERKGGLNEAINIFEVGIKEASVKHDQHALRELNAALNQLKDEIDS